MKNTLLATVSLLSAALLAGCGGGGGDDAAVVTPAASAEGVYGGIVTDKPGSSEFRMVVLDGSASARQYWMVYGTPDPAGFIAKGLVQGDGLSTSFGSVNTFVSSNALEFSNLLLATAALSSNYTVAGANKTIAGTVTVTGNPTPLNFNGGAIPGATYNYNAAASLATVEGSWTVTGLQDEDYALVVTAGGNFTATPTDGNPGTSPDPGCPFSGTLTPRPSGKNVFNVTFLTGASAVDCTYPNEASSGVAIAYPVAGGTQLILAVTKNTDRQRGAVVAGLKP